MIPSTRSPASALRDRGRALLDVLIAFLAAPAFILLDQLRRWRLRRLRGDWAWSRVHDVRVENQELIIVGIDCVERLGFDALDEVWVCQLEGDAGFADANSLHWLLRVVERGGTERSVEFSESYPHLFRRQVIGPLQKRGVCVSLEEVEGPVQGLGAALLYATGLVWLLVAILVASLT